MHPILLDLPEIITTSRSCIEVIKPGDGPEINRAVLESFENLHKWIPWARSRPTEEDSEAKARKSYARWILREELGFAIRDKETREFIGCVGVPRLCWEIPRFEIGYWIKTSLAGKGYASEATNAMVAYCFEKLRAKRVEIRCDEENRGSVAVAQKLGFHLEARQVNLDLDYVTGKPSVTLLFSKVSP